MRRALAICLILLGGCGRHDGRPASDNSYLARRSAFDTKLVRMEPAPQEWVTEAPPAGVQEIQYWSGDLPLKAWIRAPDSQAEKRPALVYFHGGFAFGAGDFRECEPFVEAGYVVMTPMLRGENGNPGAFELFWGEVDDAKAAVQWLADQPFVDRDRIYTFGHSVGGGISALLSLLDDVPIRHGGSSGGLYGPRVLDAWSDIAPFDVRDTSEKDLRVLLGNIRWMQRAHYAYIGIDDALSEEADAAKREMRGQSSLLHIRMLPGDHFSTLGPSLRMYLKVTEEDR